MFDDPWTLFNEVKSENKIFSFVFNEAKKFIESNVTITLEVEVITEGKIEFVRFDLNWME